MASVRGTPAYWEKTKFEVLAMIRQLGIPTFFLTVSAADLKWPDMIRAIAQQFGQNFTDEQIASMSFSERCKWLQANPVTAARHFDFRVQALFREVILSKAQPIGHVVDSFRRLEAQARGSLHLHSILWVKDAPKIGINSDLEVVNFIDKYCTTRLPAETDNFFELVKRQRHNHTKTCEKKKMGECRFRFPRDAREETVIIREHPKGVLDCGNIAAIDKKEILSEVGLWEVLVEINEWGGWKNFGELLNAAKINLMHRQFIADNNCDIERNNILRSEIDSNVLRSKKICSKIEVHLKRRPDEIYINSYNETILRAWQANMDLQYVTNAQAVVRYILDYICKPERELGEAMKAAIKDLPAKCAPRERLKKLGNVFLNSRILSAQEAAVRSVGLPLKNLSRTVVFVNTNYSCERVRILKSHDEIANLHRDSENVFKTGIIERYIARPESVNSMCLAEFASLYKSASKSSVVSAA
jgi:hypothetical protein